MIHKIKISTAEALTINKALRMDLGNDTDNYIAASLIERINKSVIKNLRKYEKKQKGGVEKTIYNAVRS